MKLFLAVLILFLSFEAFSKEYPLSDHYDGERFFNPQGHDLKNLRQVFKWQITKEKAEWPENVPNTNYTLPSLGENKGVLTFINHASFLLQLKNLNILTDPVYSERTSPFTFMGPKRVKEAGIPFDSLPAIDVVLISHNHYDHLDIETLKRLDAKNHPLFLVPLGDEELLKDAGIQNVKEMDWWEEIKVKDTKITFAPAQHWSARGLFDKCESLWGSFFIDHEGSKIYFGGDTGSGPHFLQIKSRLGAPDIALLPIGAYEPRWFMKAHHMNPEDAVNAHIQLSSSLSFGMHFGTFQLTDEAYDQPVKDLNAAREKLNISSDAFRVLDQGESYSF